MSGNGHAIIDLADICRRVKSSPAEGEQVAAFARELHLDRDQLATFLLSTGALASGKGPGAWLETARRYAEAGHLNGRT
jgi:hypothetical protein